jgi:hypothetical protein
MPRLSLLLVLVALLAAIVGATYALRFDPELAFWTEASKRKLSWVDKMRGKHGRVIGIVGGSTTTFAIDAQMLEEICGLPVANLGLHAGMGPEVCAGFGFTALQSGDTLIVSLEPSMLTGEQSGPTSLGVRMAWALGQPAILNWGNVSAPWRHLVNPAKLQPGGYHVMTMLGKLALAQPPYRYSIKDTRPGGLQTTSERRPSALSEVASDGGSIKVSEYGHTLLAEIRDEAAARGIRVAYLLPWAYASNSEANAVRQRNKQLLQEVGKYLPVIEEPELGLQTEPDKFADSRQHLTEQAARKRSEQLAPLLRRFTPTTGSADN